MFSTLKSNNKGFTLIELMIVVVILGILATIAIGTTLRIIERGYIKTVESDLSAAYKAALAHHTDDPDSEITVEILKQKGYSRSDRVDLTIVDGTVKNLKISATHPGVTGVYEVDSAGRIKKQ